MHTIYNLGYYERMLRLNSKTAEYISKVRCEFIMAVYPKTVLDYGSGVGWFRAFRPEGIEVDTYDIGDYPQTGMLREDYDVVCFWDVLEHIPNLAEIEFQLHHTKHIALSIPIKPENIKLEKWKHFKPAEHLHYFTIEMLDALFKPFNFERIKDGYPEVPPRVDVYSALYAKINTSQPS